MKRPPVQVLWGLLAAAVLCRSTAATLTKECVDDRASKVRSFSSLVEYQGTKYSFNPRHPGYRGNSVEFSFQSINALPKNSFVSFDSNSIIKINLSHKGIERIEEGAFFGLFCLRRLELSNNNISFLPEGVFEALENLRELDLSGNLLEEIPRLVFSTVGSLTVLDLSRNRIRTLAYLDFFNLTQLEVLDLSYNRVRSIPSNAFIFLPSVKELRLNKNNLHEITPEKWSGLDGLVTLTLADNFLTKFDTTYNFSFANLRNLNLSGNYLTSLNTYALRKHFPKLEMMDISENNWFCVDLEVIKHSLMDSKIVLGSPVNCSSTRGEYRRRTTSTTSTTPAPPARRVKEYSKDVYVQNGEILLTSKKLEAKVEYLEALLIYMFVLLAVFMLLDVSIRVGFCQCLFEWVSGRRGYIDRSDAETMILLRRR